MWSIVVTQDIFEVTYVEPIVKCRLQSVTGRSTHNLDMSGYKILCEDGLMDLRVSCALSTNNFLTSLQRVHSNSVIKFGMFQFHAISSLPIVISAVCVRYGDFYAAHFPCRAAYTQTKCYLWCNNMRINVWYSSLENTILYTSALILPF